MINTLARFHSFLHIFVVCIVIIIGPLETINYPHFSIIIVRNNRIGVSPKLALYIFLDLEKKCREKQ